MANAIKKVSVARGYNVTQYTLQCFGGAAGQHACLIADAVGMAHIYIPRHAGVLSAYGLGLADVTKIVSRTIELPLGAASRPLLEAAFGELTAQARARLAAGGSEAAQISCQPRVHARYEGTDTALLVDDGTEVEIQSRFESAYRRRYSFLTDNKPLVIEPLAIEALCASGEPPGKAVAAVARNGAPAALARRRVYLAERWQDIPVHRREALAPGDTIDGPALVAEPHATTVVEP